jgi:hypothetical protein
MNRSLSLSAPTRVAVGLLVMALGLSACSQDTGPGSESDLIDALTRDGTFEQDEAECIAETVFNEYGEDEDALQRITRTDDYDTLTGDGEDAVEGFGEFFDNTISFCTGG